MYNADNIMQRSQVAIKIVVFSVLGTKLKIFIKDEKLPSRTYNNNITLDNAASLVFEEEIGISLTGLYFEQLYTVSHKKKSTSEIDVIYYFLIPEYKIYPSINKKLLELKQIHSTQEELEIISYATQRLRWKIEYTNVVYSLLPDEFTFSQLQSTYEAILGRVLDKRNFRKKIIALNLLAPTGNMKHEGRARPAEMFAFQKRKLTIVRIL